MKTLKEKLFKKQIQYCGTLVEGELQEKIYEDVKQAVLDEEILVELLKNKQINIIDFELRRKLIFGDWEK